MIKIITDSTSDLSEELIDRYDIRVLPLHVLLGENEYKDGVDITPEDIYKWADENKTTPKTSAPSVDDAVELFKPLLDEGNELVCFAISETMSASAQYMRVAAENLDAEERISVIDSANLSTGIGLLVIEAAIMAKDGKNRNEILKAIEEYKPRVRASFVVDTLTYLHRGGRCSSIAALAGGALKLHPKIIVADGVMGADKKYRGKYEMIMLKYAMDMESELRAAKADRVFITHSGMDKDIVDAVRKYLAGLGVFQEIHETRAGGVVSSHCGPGTLGVLFIAGESR